MAPHEKQNPFHFLNTSVDKQILIQQERGNPFLKRVRFTTKIKGMDKSFLKNVQGRILVS